MSEEKKTTVSENRRQVILEDKYCEMAERIGDGNRSKGIRIAIEHFYKTKAVSYGGEYECEFGEKESE